jgi:hypothetical protein
LGIALGLVSGIAHATASPQDEAAVTKMLEEARSLWESSCGLGSDSRACEAAMGEILNLTATVLIETENDGSSKDKSTCDYTRRLEALKLRADVVCALGHHRRYREVIDQMYSMRSFEADDFHKTLILDDARDCPFGPYSDSEPIVLPLPPLRARLLEGFAETPCRNDYGDRLPIEVLRLREPFALLPPWEKFWEDLKKRYSAGSIDFQTALHSLSDTIQYPVFDERKTWLDQIAEFDSTWAETLVMDDFADALDWGGSVAQYRADHPVFFSDTERSARFQIYLDLFTSESLQENVNLEDAAVLQVVDRVAKNLPYRQDRPAKVFSEAMALSDRLMASPLPMRNATPFLLYFDQALVYLRDHPILSRPEFSDVKRHAIDSLAVDLSWLQFFKGETDQKNSAVDELLNLSDCSIELRISLWKRLQGYGKHGAVIALFTALEDKAGSLTRFSESERSQVVQSYIARGIEEYNLLLTVGPKSALGV